MEYDENEAEYDDGGYYPPYCTITGVKDASALPADLEIPRDLDAPDEDYRVKEIGYGAFRGLKNLRSVSLPGSVEEIGAYAFADCENLESVTLDGSVEYVGENAFVGCNSLREVHIYSFGSFCKTSFKNKYSNPIYLAKDVYFINTKLEDTLVIPSKFSPLNKIERIGKYAFCGCDIHTLKLSDGIENFSIESEAFSDCSKLTSVILPDSLRTFDPTGLLEVKTIKYTYYNGMKYLGSVSNPYKALVDISENASEYTLHPDTEIICRTAFSHCSDVKVIYLPDSLVHTDAKAFTSCQALNYVILPENLKIFDPTAILNCKSIVYNEYNGLKYLGSETDPFKAVVGFSERASTYELHPDTDVIGANAFANNPELEKIVIPEGVTHVNDRAFTGCCCLKTLYLPSTLKYIGDTAFAGCRSLEQVHIPDAATWCGITFGSGKLSISVDTNPASNAELYFGDTLAENVVIPQGVTEIKSNAFKYCKKIKSVTLPDGLEFIGSSAFSCCDSLTSINIPNSVKTIEICAFVNCKSLKTIELPPVKEVSWDLFGLCSALESVKLSVGTEIIARDAFSNCTALKSVEFPQGLKTIGETAFKNCHSLNEVYIPDTVTDIGYEAFLDCRALQKLHLPDSLATLNSGAFKKCKSLKEVVISSVELVGHHAFEECTSLESVRFSAGTKDIGCEAFYGCKRLTRVDIANGVERIIGGAFEHCTLLREITLPNTLKYIGYNAFAECSLCEIEIPDGVTTIERLAFGGCSLKRAQIPDSVEQIGYDIFKRCPSELEIIASDEIKKLIEQADSTQTTVKKSS